MSLTNIQNIILVLSGKGGVGKSSVTTQLGLTLSTHGHSVGILDIDLTGPSIPRFLGVESARVRQAPGGWIPVPVHPSAPARGALSCMSLGFLLGSREDAVIWRGPKKTAMVRQFLESVLWDSAAGVEGKGLDYLLIDTPPGTSDEHISLLETLLKTAAPEQMAGAVVVTTPQAISISDVKKELNFCRKVGLRVLGVVENMAGFVCPNCMECTHVFSKGGGEVMASEFEVPFLGSVPVDPAFVMLIEEGRRPVYPKGTVVAGKDVSGPEEQVKEEGDVLLVDNYRLCSLFPIFDGIVGKLVEDIASRRE